MKEEKEEDDIKQQDKDPKPPSNTIITHCTYITYEA